MEHILVAPGILPDTGSKLPDTGSKLPNTGSKLPDRGSEQISKVTFYMRFFLQIVPRRIANILPTGPRSNV